MCETKGSCFQIEKKIQAEEAKLPISKSVPMNGTLHEYFSEMINETKKDSSGSNNVMSMNNSTEVD